VDYGGSFSKIAIASLGKRVTYYYNFSRKFLSYVATENYIKKTIFQKLKYRNFELA
jgi:hypothetical protein